MAWAWAGGKKKTKPRSALRARRRSGPWRATEQVRAGTAARRRCGAALAPRLSLELGRLCFASALVTLNAQHVCSGVTSPLCHLFLHPSHKTPVSPKGNTNLSFLEREWPVRLGCTKPGTLLIISNVTLGGLRMQSTSTCGKVLGCMIWSKP